MSNSRILQFYDGDAELYEAKEKDLHYYFYESVKEDFHTAYEVTGESLVQHTCFQEQKVRADFLLYPRQHLLDIGFADTWFAVEIKRGKTHLSEAMRQAFWYTLCCFEVKGRQIIPGFSVGYVPGSSATGATSSGDWFQKGERSAFGYLNVGQMVLNVKDYCRWRIQFHTGNKYAQRYSKCEKRGLLEDTYHVSQDRKAFRVRAGNGTSTTTHSGATGHGGTGGAV